MSTMSIISTDNEAYVANKINRTEKECKDNVNETKIAMHGDWSSLTVTALPPYQQYYTCNSAASASSEIHEESEPVEESEDPDWSIIPDSVWN